MERKKKIIKLTMRLLLLIVAVGICLFTYYFIISKRSSDPNLFAVCSNNKGEIVIDLASGFKYITNYKARTNKDTLYVDIYVTTLANFFNKNKQINVILPKGDIKYIYVNDIKHELKECDIDKTY